MFHGSIVALLTPMKENGDVDYAGLEHLVNWHLEQHTDAILVMGTTGESATLTIEEQDNVIKTVIQEVHNKIPVIAGSGTNSTKTSIERTQKAMELGVQACLLVTPYYNCPTQEGLYQHYRSIAEKVPIPQILYNIPKRSGIDLLPETVARLAGITNIVGIKEGRPDCAKAIIEYCGTSIDIYSGDDSSALEIIRLGGKGVVSVVANLLPKIIHNLCETAKKAYVAGEKADWAEVENINQKLQDVYESVFIETNPIPVKWLAKELKHISTAKLRLPLTTLSSAHQTALKPIVKLLETFT